MIKITASYRPAFTKRFWFKLTIVYTVVSVFGIKAVLSVFDTLNHYHDFNEAMQPASVLEEARERLKPIRRLIESGALSTQDIADTPEIIDDQMFRVSMKRAHSVAAHIRASSDPKLSYVVFDGNDRPIAKYLKRDDQHSIALLMAHRAPVVGGEAIVPDDLPDSVYINIPLSSREPTTKGRIALLITAKFSLAKLFNRDEDLISTLMPLVITLCIVLSGYLASKNFVRRLRHITSVSSAWREGDLDHRIIDNVSDELSEHSQNLNAMAQELKELLGLKQETAIQDERTRMARELHDTVKQNLFALSLQLAAINSKALDLGEAKQNLAEARHILKQAQEQLVGVISELRTIGPKQEGTAANLLALCENLERKFNVLVHCVIPPDLKLTNSQFFVVSRVIQESVTNAIRHGKAVEIIIRLVHSETGFNLRIEDDGMGFNPILPTTGTGILSMRERAASLPVGTFAIETAAGQGTTIVITWEEQPSAT
ncbi:MAG: histidine kinase [Candidatus Paceibacterota bacterium]|jgi:NarL family two-component system sensor histidine kinase LiaS